jgi:fatty acid CoA ligase FadD9
VTPELEDEVLEHMRSAVLGGRHLLALTGSAPTSPDLLAWAERLLDMHILEGYGMTEAGAVALDGVIRRPPIRDY